MSAEKRLAVVALALIVVAGGGCATIRRQSVATTLAGSPPLVVSSELDEALSTENFALVNVTFENKGVDWVEVTRVELEPADDLGRHVSVVTGQELGAWADAMRRVLEVKRVNEESAYGWSLITLSAIASVRGASPERVTAVLQTIDLAKTAFADEYKDDKRAERLTTVPVGHLLAGVVLVPPGLHADRWILLRTRGEAARPKALKAKLTVAGGAESTVLLFTGQEPHA